MGRFTRTNGRRVKGVRFYNIIAILSIPLLLYWLTLFLNRETSTSSGVTFNIAQETSKNIISLDVDHIPTTLVWEQICTEGGILARSTQSNGSPIVAIEVGMWDLHQCLFAATQGMQTHCVEASRKSYNKRVMKWVSRHKKSKGDVNAAVKRISTYNMAAGNASNVIVPFRDMKRKNDHVGDFDLWNMTNGNELENSIYKRKRYSEVVMIKLDDLIENKITPTDRGENIAIDSKIQDVFILKVDTLGFEPEIFSGLMRSTKLKKIDFILFNYWPKGMDLQSHSAKCVKSVAFVKQLHDAGYKLYTLGVNAHPRYQSWYKATKWFRRPRPLDDINSYCNWYYEVDDQFPYEGYKMGYWSDIFAVSPNVKLSNPTTEIGTILFG